MELRGPNGTCRHCQTNIVASSSSTKPDGNDDSYALYQDAVNKKGKRRERRKEKKRRKPRERNAKRTAMFYFLAA
ncbi:hypothetical protein GWI33_016930 [Rhynchophorus ferrugineus]|uniref:Uncharacterized protein n=1 Tax=Rhynchophorus ferrugineus TaxID=354439 RepID=A0A834IA68_RHYFE|nr:hypothetical protein GWI33_016930 [Rhynchophorus ferrugineus]